MPNYTVVPAAEMKRIISSGATILDVRREEEHYEQRILALHDLIPIDTLDPTDYMLRRGLDKNAPVYILCRSGMRARKAADLFAGAGYKNTYVIDGGIVACALGGTPVEGTACGGTACTATPTNNAGGCA